jgi:hypothetical protein
MANKRPQNFPAYPGNTTSERYAAMKKEKAAKAASGSANREVGQEGPRQARISVNGGRFGMTQSDSGSATSSPCPRCGEDVSHDQINIHANSHIGSKRETR